MPAGGGFLNTLGLPQPRRMTCGRHNHSWANETKLRFTAAVLPWLIFFLKLDRLGLGESRIISLHWRLDYRAAGGTGKPL